jgi:hypothetical protein
MKFPFSQLFGVALAALVASTNALAYCWGTDTTMPGGRPDFYTVAQEYERSRLVAIVKVKKETWLNQNGKPAKLKPPFLNEETQPLGFDPYNGAIYLVDVVKVFKGKNIKRVALFSENSTSRFPMQVGESYLAFASTEQTDKLGPMLMLDNCGNSGALVDRSEALETVRHIANR